MTDYILLIIAFFLSAVCGFIFIPMIQNFCIEKKLYDIPDIRKVHPSAVPRLGGISFLPSMFLAFLAATLTYNRFTGVSEVTFSLWSLYFFISLLFIYVVGLIDDLIGLGAGIKFVVQVVAASLLPLAGLYLNNFYGAFGINEIPFYIGAPLTVFIIVFVDNAINLIDGIDGLASGISFIALAGFLVCFLDAGMILYAILIAALLGVLVPFMYFNIFCSADQNRKIFMGDSGSLTLGFILGFLAIKYSMDNPNVKFWHPDCLLLSYTFLAVPVFDVVRVTLVRLKHKVPISQADKNHIHHKLLRAGFSQRKTLICLLLTSIFYIAMNLMLRAIPMPVTAIVFIDIAVWIGIQQIINTAVRRNGQQVYLEQQIK